ncbi:hypothetical protein DICVIV_13881 [Dictyocaulus viviparus]|uniref:Uncharacterized protein n=1 Tax=Dictyocaulus viviparus TaxID=29172 RepID=A0A0D8X6N3_DICVI|nr:hypothetical protein DICVIV_13881 [Dictyocaulus viviparus]
MLYYIIVMFITIIDNIVVNPMIFDVNVSSNHERLKSLQSNSVANSDSFYIFTTTYTTPQLSSKKKIKRKLERNPRLIKSRETLKSISKSSDTFLTPANINVLNLPADKYTRTNRYRRSISTIPLYKSMEEISQMAKFTTIGQIRQYLLKEANIVQINPLQFDVKKFRDEVNHTGPTTKAYNVLYI